ncbi:hypothetical protein GCM10007036_10600 [Alsobacter metallidurans]|uniref:Uncharacterized protein n=1 Tax=Alsobacter metallidurans TaxID=340221 RepID=A0A917I445_9HYPH|nr:hypothetical protein GCM10007036_10600 [Alsobacter metallidurans]
MPQLSANAAESDFNPLARAPARIGPETPDICQADRLFRLCSQGDLSLKLSSKRRAAGIRSPLSGKLVIE